MPAVGCQSLDGMGPNAARVVGELAGPMTGYLAITGSFCVSRGVFRKLARRLHCTWGDDDCDSTQTRRRAIDGAQY